MKPVREVISREIIDDLWGAGYTILPRRRHPDPFHVPPEMAPQGRSYQWWHLVHDRFHFALHDNTGWAPVPASRHDGYFMPAGHVGDIEVNGLGLFEKPKFEVEQERAANTASAHQAVHDWKQMYGSVFSGEVSVGGEKTAIGETKSYENTTAIPLDMVPYIDKIFQNRDWFADGIVKGFKYPLMPHAQAQVEGIQSQFDAAMEKDPSAPKWPTMNAIILPYAIANVRKQIKEAASGEAS